MGNDQFKYVAPEIWNQNSGFPGQNFDSKFHNFCLGSIPGGKGAGEMTIAKKKEGGGGARHIYVCKSHIVHIPHIWGIYLYMFAYTPMCAHICTYACKYAHMGACIKLKDQVKARGGAGGVGGP